MIVRDPENRAPLDEVMSDTWYRQCEDDDDVDDQHYVDSLPLISHRTISQEDHQVILELMVNGKIGQRDDIIQYVVNCINVC